MPKTAERCQPRCRPPRADADAASTRRLAWLIGPALVAGVAYLDPGNVASNMTAGARYGYLLVWVVVLGNVMAWLIQYLSAKLGIVTGRSLPETLGRRIRNRWGRRAYWLQAELVAMATDIAEVIGGAVALNLLFGIPLLWGGVITGTVSIVLLLIQSRRGPRSFEFVVIGMVAIIAIGFTFGVFVGTARPARRSSAASCRASRTPARCCSRHPSSARRSCRTRSTRTARSRATASRRPRRRTQPARDAASIGRRTDPAPIRIEIPLEELRGIPTARLLRATKWDVSIAMLIAGTVNLCILLLAAANLAGVPGTDTLEGAYAAL